ncbi:hypothetical protein NXS98_15210 [Fontisphaera persica]|uniref:hypothetical protein n=1 Tax=Fontisphaera persica TaxID=2974023 RepID=UPI0024BFD12B|nr:hypothetical protein [Fontisphaera persica]WCJ59048.1 hypothetical protein NXS98_15210 [Fontisphaera persica]
MTGTALQNSTPPLKRETSEPQTLRELFTAQHHGNAQEYEREVLFQCAYSPVLVRLAWRLDPDFFLSDLQLIRAVGCCRTFGDCRHEVEAFRRANPPRGFFRKTLRVRLSGQKLLKMASRLFLSQSLPSRTAAR